jgi:hypothetical protein
MNARVSRIWLYGLCVALGLPALLWGMSAALAQAPPPADISAAATVASRINYQGEWREGGVPVTGKRTMTVRLYSNSTCASLLQTIALGSVPVTDGRFSVAVNVNQALFNGQGVWLRLQVGTTFKACQELLPAPYALSLRPGAIIQGVTSCDPSCPVLKIWNQAGSSSGVTNGIYVNTAGSYALYATTAAESSSAVYGRSNTSYGVRGVSVKGTGGYFTSQRGTSLWATTASYTTTHYAGYFSAREGFGVYARSELNNAILGEGGSDTPGSLMPPAGPVGVTGLAAGQVGVHGVSRDAAGVYGKSATFIGVYGQSNTYMGVDASSGTGNGLQAGSYTSTAILGGSHSGNLIELWDDEPRLERRFSVANSGDVWADGPFTAPGLDLSEHINVSESVEVGDVLEVDPENPGYFRRSRGPYSTLVVGVVSSMPAFAMVGYEGDTRPLVAWAGQASVKATTQNGDIHPGDLLVASLTSGRAMRAVSPPAGTVIGKALGGLSGVSGTEGFVLMQVLLR